MTPISDEQRWEAAKRSGDIARIAATARALTEKNSKVDTSYRFTVCDKMWTPMASVGSDLMEGSGARPRNDCPTGKLMLKGSSPLIQMFMDCRNTLVGVEMETAGSRQNFYTKVHRYRYEKGAWTGNVEMRGIWDILNYYVIWPTWWLPLAAQPISHAIFIWALQTCVENMVAECALRIQSGWLEFVNNGLSLNGDIRAWMGTILQALKRDGLSVQTFGKMLRTPTYVQRTNPFLDTSPMCAKTVRMETCGTVIKDVTRAYGVDTRMDLWRPGDPQPDKWANLDSATYVFSTRDRQQISGPTKTVADSVIKTVIDLGGSLGDIFKPVIAQVPGMNGVFYAPKLGVDFEQPYAYVVAPEEGEDSNIISCEIADHTPEGWQHIIGGRSPKWAGAPRFNRRGAPAQRAKTLTQRPYERNVRVVDRLADDRGRVLRHPVRSALGIPEQQLPGVPDGPGVPGPRRGGPLSSGHRAVLPDRQRPVQHRNHVRVHQRDFRCPRHYHGAGHFPQR